ncbi:uncharacterized protein LOC143453362 [Clavelina lepadiformis]|uniref:ShKT domain-containing protein n=1 Tax=Clavelina lepadiformis TaxID=159417 RepID=A0ABP0GWY5_CLALP
MKIAVLITLFACQHAALGIRNNLISLLFENLSNNVAPPATCRSDCKNAFVGCILYSPYCNDGTSKAIMARRLCPITCKQCTPCKTSAPLCQEEPCFDNHPFCYSFQNAGLCESNYQAPTKTFEFVSSNCRKSCGLCGDQCKLPPIEEQCDEDCGDLHPGCGIWKEKGFCADDTPWPHVFKYCPLSCEVCKPCAIQKSGDLPPINNE